MVRLLLRTWKQEEYDWSVNIYAKVPSKQNISQQNNMTAILSKRWWWYWEESLSGTLAQKKELLRGHAAVEPTQASLGWHITSSGLYDHFHKLVLIEEGALTKVLSLKLLYIQTAKLFFISMTNKQTSNYYFLIWPANKTLSLSYLPNSYTFIVNWIDKWILSFFNMSVTFFDKNYVSPCQWK